MQLEVNILDFATPEMEFLIKNQKQITSKALRRTVFHFRKRLIEYMANSSTIKKSLESPWRERVEARAQVKSKHIHPYLTKWKGKGNKGKFYKVLRVYNSDKQSSLGQGGQTPLAYTFGFLGDDARQGANFGRGASRKSLLNVANYARAMVEGGYYDKKQGTIKRDIPISMRRYFYAIGVRLKAGKSQLDYKPDPLVTRFLNAKRVAMVVKFTEYFKEELRKKIEREAKRLGPKIYDSKNIQRQMRFARA